MRILCYILVVLFLTTSAVGQQINPVPDYIFRNSMSVGRNAPTDTSAYFSIGPRFGATRGFMPPMVVDTAAVTGTKRNGLLIYSIQRNSFLYWDSTGMRWSRIAANLDTLLLSTRAWRQKGIDSVASVRIGGSGVTGYIPKFTAARTLDSSQIVQSDGKIGVGNPTSYDIGNDYVSYFGKMSIRGGLRVSSDSGENLMINTGGIGTANGRVSYRANVLGIRHTDVNGSSAIRLLRASDGAEVGAIGYQNGTGSFYLDSATFIAATQPYYFNAPDDRPMRLILGQEGLYDGVKRNVARFEATRDWEIKIRDPYGNDQFILNPSPGTQTYVTKQTYSANGNVNFTFENTNSGTNASANLRFITNGYLNGLLGASNVGNTYGAYPAGGVHLVSRSPRGLTLMANDASGFIDIVTGGELTSNRRARIHANGRMTLNDTADAGFQFAVNGTARTGTLTVNTNGQGRTISTTYPSGALGFNIFIGGGGGSLSAVSGNDASYNTSVGVTALNALTTGQGNSALGLDALNGTTTGYENSGFGVNAGRANTTGYQNVFFGTQAGRYHSGFSNVTAANNSVYIGYLTKASGASPTNEIVIGANTDGFGSNTVTIGNSSITQNYFRGEMLVGYTSDQGAFTLQVNGNALINGNIRTAAPAGGTANDWRLGTVATVSPTSPNRTIEVSIGGTIYYIHAKTTND